MDAREVRGVKFSASNIEGCIKLDAMDLYAVLLRDQRYDTVVPEDPERVAYDCRYLDRKEAMNLARYLKDQGRDVMVVKWGKEPIE